MPEQCPHSVSDQDQIPTLTDQQWTEFVSDAHAMRQAETTLEAGMADLLARPFDESAQLQLRQVLDSDQLRRATQIARSMFPVRRPASRRVSGQDGIGVSWVVIGYLLVVVDSEAAPSDSHHESSF